MLKNNLPYVVEPMRVDDVPQVMLIERDAFPLPWPERAYRYELSQNQHSHYVVLRHVRDSGSSRGWKPWRRFVRQNSRSPIVGYGGFWMIAGEAHISTIAVAVAWRRKGLGELLLVSMLGQAGSMGAFEATLEVRVSNLVAQNLYRKYGFETVGRRRRYYQDNGEDAWIMTVKNFNSRAYQARLKRMGLELYERLSQRAQE
jgi:ribosomal-protein-alanine N-acetyltransferase